MEPTTRLLIYNGTLIDGSGAPAQPGTSVLVDGNRVAAVEPAQPPRNGDAHGPIAVIDATGKTIMPGLIDAHCHMTYGEPRAEEELDLYASLEYRALRAAWNAQKVLRAGVWRSSPTPARPASPTRAAAASSAWRCATRSRRGCSPARG